MFQAVEIDGEHYWDGGFTANPAIYPLLYECTTPDILMVLLNPLQLDEAPRSAEDISARSMELGFSTTFLREMRMIAHARRHIAETTGWMPLGRLERKLVGQRFHRMRLLHRQGGAHGQVPDQAATAAARDLAHHAIAGRGGHRGVVKAEDAKAHGGRLRGSSAAMIRPRVTYLPAATIGRGPGAFRRRSPIQARIRLQCAPLACGRSFPRWSAGAGNPLWFPAPAPLRLLSLRKLGRAVLAPPHPFSQRGFRERFESRPVPHSACMRRHTRVWRRRTRPVGRHWSLTHDV